MKKSNEWKATGRNSNGPTGLKSNAQGSAVTGLVKQLVPKASTNAQERIRQQTTWSWTCRNFYRHPVVLSPNIE